MRPLALVIDDDPTVLIALHDMLRCRLPRLRVETTSSVGDALARLEARRYSVVLTDFRMPRMDGIEATRQIRALLPETVVIGMSCHSGRDVEATLLGVGANAFIPKEDVPDKIFAVIARELDQPDIVPRGTH